jgi:predicted AAA+ superfamily ATPase
MQTLVQLLRTRVGSPVSYSSLAGDLQISPATVKNWLEMLENLYVVFRVTPYHQNIARALLKEPKYYFYDTAKVLLDEGARFENLVALTLMKELHYLEDVKGVQCKLHYLRSKDKKEIDFMIQVGINNTLLIEVKLSDDQLSPNFKTFEPYFPKCRKIQIVKNLKKEKFFPDGSEVRLAANWLKILDF